MYKVYQIVFPNGKYYIGITTNLSRRIIEHKCNAYTKKKTTPLYCAIRKHGFSNLKVLTLVKRLPTLKDANHSEQILIKELKTQDRRYGYNFTEGGDGTKGKKLTVEQKQHISQTQKALWSNPAYRKKMKEANSNKRSIDKEKREQINEVLRQKFKLRKQHPWKGRQHSQKTKQLKRRVSSNRKQIIDLDTGIVYLSLNHAAECNPDIHKDTIRNLCNGKYKNPSSKRNFKYVEDKQ